MRKIKAYKVFDENWICQGLTYKIGETKKLEGNPIMCEKGFHACIQIKDCFSYKSFDPKNKIAEVELSGIILGMDEEKQCASQIKIIRELTWEEMLKLANIGIGNSGHSNSGNRNSGNSNSGNRNSGNRNSGTSNSGNWNSGTSNSGNWNSGTSNSGNSNSGNWNSGTSNSGHSNSGNSNSGNRNSGNRNSGNWNSVNFETGCFNSSQSDFIRVFNKKCKREIWEIANKPKFIYIQLNDWVPFDNMTNQEKINIPKAYVCNGYLKTYSYKEAWANSYKNASKEDIELLKALPNYSHDVFMEITGIDVPL